ncbi:type II secretion system protein [Entomomonas asaccharolytica]|uniref:Type II secretion system protein n=1 Tax=Entomomonas asaccharolytica TaxID=2785331 RepID=A0A974NHD0_9GAMM|nr:type II secretion system protein [Entomomonas asaccharolytica]QQP86626.1 type II secretion system protein [Entomomonas asaccharolytica]
MLSISRLPQKTSGFTLLEILLVITIISIVVAGIAFWVLNFTSVGSKLLNKQDVQIVDTAPKTVDIPIKNTGQIVINLTDEPLQILPVDEKLLFAFDKDIKIGTEWPTGNAGLLVKSYDGIQVELIGYNYLKANRQVANSGYAALKDLDTNSDNILDEFDIDFTNLYVWLDTNQNGVVDRDELHSLQKLGIKSLNIASVVNKNIRVNKSIITKQGQFIQEDGSKGSFVEINLFQDPYYREFTDKIAVSENAKKLPNIKASGYVRDLQEAVTLNPDLYPVIVDYFAIDLADRRFNQMDQIIFEWSKTLKNPYLESRLKSISTPKFDIRLGKDLQFDKYTDIALDNQKIVAGLMAIEAFTGQRQLHFFKTEVLNSLTQTWELNLIISFENQVIMSQTISANPDGTKKQVLLSSDMLSFTPEQRLIIRKKYDMVVENLYKKLQELQGDTKQNIAQLDDPSDQQWVDKSLQEQINTGQYFRKPQKVIDYPRRRHMSECVKPGNIIDQQVRDCAAGKISKTW